MMSCVITSPAEKEDEGRLTQEAHNAKTKTGIFMYWLNLTWKFGRFKQANGCEFGEGALRECWIGKSGKSGKTAMSGR